MMSISLPLTSMTAPADGAAAKPQSKDLDALQASVFGEVLKVEEKKLKDEQEGAALSAAAVMASMQVRPVTGSVPAVEAGNETQTGASDKQPAAGLTTTAPVTGLQPVRTSALQENKAAVKGMGTLPFMMIPAPAVETLQTAVPQSTSAPAVETLQTAVPQSTSAPAVETLQTAVPQNALTQTVSTPVVTSVPGGQPVTANKKPALQAAAPSTTPSLTDMLPNLARDVQEKTGIEKGTGLNQVPAAAEPQSSQSIQAPVPAADASLTGRVVTANSQAATPAVTITTPPQTAASPVTARVVQERTPVGKGTTAKQLPAVEIPQSQIRQSSAPVPGPASANLQAGSTAIPVADAPLAAAVAAPVQLGQSAAANEQPAVQTASAAPLTSQPLTGVFPEDTLKDVREKQVVEVNMPVPAPAPESSLGSSQVEPAAQQPDLQIETAAPMTVPSSADIPAGKTALSGTENDLPKMQSSTPAPVETAPQFTVSSTAAAVHPAVSDGGLVMGQPARSDAGQAAASGVSAPLPGSDLISSRVGQEQQKPIVEAQTLVVESGVAVPIVQAEQPLPEPQAPAVSGVDVRNEKTAQPAPGPLFAAVQPEAQNVVVEAEARTSAVTRQSTARVVEKAENIPAPAAMSAEKPAALQSIVTDAENSLSRSAVQFESEVRKVVAQDPRSTETKLTPAAGQTGLPSDINQARTRVDPTASPVVPGEGSAPAVTVALKGNGPVAAQPETAAQVRLETAAVKKIQPQTAERATPEEPEIKPLAGSAVPVRAPVGMPAAGQASTPQIDPLAADVVQQVMSQMKVKIKSGNSTMNIQLNPRELGAIEIQMVSSPKGVSVTFFAEQPGTGQMLESQMNQLRQSFKDAGIQLAGLNIGLQDQHRPEGGFSRQSQYFEQHFQRNAPQAENVMKEMERLQRVGGSSTEVDYLI